MRNTGSAVRTVNVLDTVVDTTPPTATVSYSTTGATNQNVVATLTGASEPITITNNSGSATYTFTGNSTFTFTFVDLAGNTGSATATVTNIDTTAPTLVVVGSGSLTLSSGSTYTESGANWTDNVDGTGFVATPFSGSVNTSQTGVYTLSYRYVDQAGNTGSTTRTVTVIPVPDTTPPVVTLIGSGSETVYSGATYHDSGATWTDAYDNNSGTILAFNSGTLNMNQTGTYTIYYQHADAAGNTGSITRTVTVVDRFTGGGTNSFTGPAVYLSGATTTGITFSAGTGTINLIKLGSSLIIPTNNLTILASGGAWNGIIDGPTFIHVG